MEKELHTTSEPTRVLTSCTVWLGAFAFGLTNNLLSPALVELKNKYGTSIEDISKVFSIILAFHMFGALTCTFIFRFVSRQLTIAALLFTIAACIVIIPHLPSKSLFFITGGFLGFASGGYDTAQIAWILEMWHPKAAKYAHMHHFSRAVGTMITPLLLQQFLLEESKGAGALPNPNLHTNSTSSLNPKILTQESQLFIPFSIGGGIVGLAALIILCQYFFMKYEPPKKEQTDQMDERSSCNNCNLEKIILIVLTAIFLGCYKGMEVCTFQFLPTFTHYINLRLPEPEGASLLFGLTSAFTGGRLLGVVAITFGVKPEILLAMNLSLALCGDLTLYFFASDSFIGLWAGVIWLGLGFSTMYACIYEYVEKYFKVTNVVVAVMVVSGAFVSAIYPIIVGYCLERNPEVLTYVVFGSITGSALSLLVLYLLTMQRCGSKTHGPGQCNLEIKMTKTVS